MWGGKARLVLVQEVMAYLAPKLKVGRQCTLPEIHRPPPPSHATLHLYIDALRVTSSKDDEQSNRGCYLYTYVCFYGARAVSKRLEAVTIAPAAYQLPPHAVRLIKARKCLIITTALMIATTQ